LDAVSLIKRMKGKPAMDDLVAEVIDNPTMIADLIAVINTDPGSVKFACTKLIRLVSEKKPGIIYGYFDEIAALLDSNNSFVKWDAITILSNLVCVDTENKFDAIFEKYFGLINDPRMITAANVVGNAWKVVMSKPYLEKEVTKRLLAVPGIVYLNKGKPSLECKNVLCGHLIDCFARYYPVSGRKDEILAFVKGQLGNSRRQVVKKAEQFLRTFNKI